MQIITKWWMKLMKVKKKLNENDLKVDQNR